MVAVFVILLCHYFLFSSLNSGIGRYLAGTGNMVFFLVSALLYGLKYPVGGQTMDYKRFVVKRITRIGASVWPFLLILVTLYLVFGVGFSWLDVGLNFVFLGYLGQLPDKTNKATSFLCDISFEVYLVHHTLCAGPFISVYQRHRQGFLKDF